MVRLSVLIILWQHETYGWICVYKANTSSQSNCYQGKIKHTKEKNRENAEKPNLISLSPGKAWMSGMTVLSRRTTRSTMKWKEEHILFWLYNYSFPCSLLIEKQNSHEFPWRGHQRWEVTETYSIAGWRSQIKAFQRVKNRKWQHGYVTAVLNQYPNTCKTKSCSSFYQHNQKLWGGLFPGVPI